MSSSGFSVDEADLEKLSPADKAELRQFFANETQRSRIRARTFACPSPFAPPSLLRQHTYTGRRKTLNVDKKTRDKRNKAS